MDRIRKQLENAKRPLIVAGNGIRLANCGERFRWFVSRTRVPFVTTWGGADLIETNFDLNLGIIGMCGQPGANLAVSQADFLLVLGSHLSLPQTGNPPESFAPNAVKAIIDIDQGQLDSLTWTADIAIAAPLTRFFDYSAVWADDLAQWGPFDEIRAQNRMPEIGSYSFNSYMTSLLPEGTVMVVDGGGTALYTGFQSSVIKLGSRLICSSSMSAMGSGLPEAIGACFANERKLTTCLIGDGSFMLNLQELATIVHHKLPIKIFLIDNGGYLAIRHTQDAFREGRHYGVDNRDLSFPDFSWIAAAFGIHYYDMDWDEELPDGTFDAEYPALFRVRCPKDQQMVKQAFVNGQPQPLSQMEIPA